MGPEQTKKEKHVSAKAEKGVDGFIIARSVLAACCTPEMGLEHPEPCSGAAAGWGGTAARGSPGLGLSLVSLSFRLPVKTSIQFQKV